MNDDWTIVSNEHVGGEDTADQLKASFDGISKIFNVNDKWTSIANPKVFQFKQSAKISTYLYAIVAGPFDFFENNKEGFPPMRIYARKTMMKEVNHVDMFHCTQVGITHYTEMFGKGYPFSKYDQVFVPEHNAGAMENVGCVTYNETFLFKG